MAAGHVAAQPQSPYPPGLRELWTPGLSRCPKQTMNLELALFSKQKSEASILRVPTAAIPEGGVASRGCAVGKGSVHPPGFGSVLGCPRSGA